MLFQEKVGGAYQASCGRLLSIRVGGLDKTGGPFS
jgi:hypothetical protein